MIAGRDTRHSPNRVGTPAHGFPLSGPALPLAEVPMLADLTWRQCRRPDCCPRDCERLHWGIIIATDQPVSHKAAVTQKVLPLKVGRGAPID